MTVAAGVANLAMSLVYLCYGTMTLFDLRGGPLDVAIVPNLAVAVLYVAIGATFAATQFGNHDRSGRWSASGLSLSGVFLTGALMHLVYAGYALEGRYEADTHILPIDVLAVAGASYFLWLVLDVHAGGIHRSASRPSPTVTAT